MPASKQASLLWLWGLSLLLSALLAALGAARPEPLPVRADLVALLVLLPPLAMAAWLLRGWRLPAAGEGGESGGGAQERL